MHCIALLVYQPQIGPSHWQPIKYTASPGEWQSVISPHVGTSVIKRLAEAAFVSSSVVAIATTAAPEPVATATASSETPSPSTSESSSSVATVATAKAPVAAVTELLLLQLWEFCGYSQLPTATVCPVLLLEHHEGEKNVSSKSQQHSTVDLSLLLIKFWRHYNNYTDRTDSSLMFSPESPWLCQQGHQNKRPVKTHKGEMMSVNCLTLHKQAWTHLQTGFTHLTVVFQVTCCV